MKITRRSPFSGKMNTMDIPALTPEKLEASVRTYEKGALIQNAFPYLNADEREFLKTGITPAEWDETFKE